MSSLILGTVGAVAGFIVGGPAGAAVGFSLGSAVGGALFPPKGPDGPRLGELTVQASSYGNPIPIPYGAVRLAGNVIWAADIVEHAHEEGGGGSGGPTYTTYSYTDSFAVAICAGPIAGVTRIWADGLLIYDIRPERQGESIGFKAGGYKLYLGTETQLPDPTIEAAMLTTPAYRGLAYWVFTDLELAKYGNRIPSLSFEVVTAATADIPPNSYFGENYNINPYDGSKTFQADLDPTTGHLWLSTMSGHAEYDALAGQWVINPQKMGVPQIQEYDVTTHELLWAYDVPVIVETTQSGMQKIMGTSETYRMNGYGVFCGGWYFIGRGEPAIPIWWEKTSTPPTSYGLAVNTQTHQVVDLVTVCAQQQFQGAFYWPGTPVPVIDNNKVYMAGENGISFGLAVGFMPASVAADPFGLSGPPTTVDYDPVPTYGTEFDTWNVPIGWTQARAKNAFCATDGFDGVAIKFPGWTYKSTVIRNPNAVIVQGYGSGGLGGGGNFISWVDSPKVSAFDLNPATVYSTSLPGSTVVMPAIAWDEANQTLWAFTGDAYGSYGSLYAITRTATGLETVYTGFSFAPVSGEFRADDVKAMTIDSATGYLRLVVGGGWTSQAYLVLFDPVNQVEISRQAITLNISYTRGLLYDIPAENKVIYADGYYIYDLPYGATLAANPVSLASIVTDISRRAGLPDGAFDTGELTDMVDGFAITHQMAARSAVEPLQQAYFFDAVESDYKVKFRKRGRAPSAYIIDADLAAHQVGQSLPALVEMRRQQELDLPQQVNVKYTNPAADYQISTQYEARLTGRSKLAVTIELPVVLHDAKAKQVASAALYSAWAERTSIKFTTSIKYATLEPTDVAVVHGRLLRLVSRKHNGLLLEWEGFADGNSQYPTDVLTQPGSGAAGTGAGGQAIPAVPGTRLQLLDIPLLQDSDAAPGFYMAAQGDAMGWRGAQVWRSTDNGISYAPLANISTASTIGTASNALAPYLGGDTFDEASVLRVVLPASSSILTLSSSPESQVLAGANAALVGNEVLQYKKAVLQNDGSYKLSGLLRGRRGTSMEGHQAGERFIALGSALVRQTAQTAEIGLPRLYKGVSSGGSLANAVAVALTDTEQALRPYAPCLLGGGFSVDGDALLRWVRRSRLDASWRDNVEVPLGEAVEAYEVEICDAAYANVLRTITGLGSPAATYTAAMQTEDFGSPQASVYFRVYQISALVGRGFAAKGCVSNPGTVPDAPPVEGETRDILQWPFAQDSIWNMPIGDGATYVPANLSAVFNSSNTADNTYAPMPAVDEEILILTPTAPATDIYINNVGWNGGDRCPATGAKLLSVPIPNDFTVPSNNENGCAAVLRADGRTVEQMQPFTRCTAGGSATALATFAAVDLYGAGIGGSHGGSRLSALGGSIRLGELRPGQTGMRHAIKVNVYARAALYNGTSNAECYRWPAQAADSYAAGWYGIEGSNTNTAMKMGALLAIPAATSLASLGLETEPAQQLAWTLQNYGAYIVDDTYGPGFAFTAEKGPAGSVKDQFAADWGYPMDQRCNDDTAWVRDIKRLLGALQVVDNNGPSSIGGGGTPRQPLAPPIAA